MCLGDIFGSMCAPCLGCFKYIGSGIGLGLVFGAGLIGIDLAADWPILLILLACIIALIWFILAYCCGGLKNKDEEEYTYLVRYFDPMCDYNATRVLAAQFGQENQHRNYSHELASTCQQIDTAMIDIYIVQVWHMLIILLIFIVLTIWFLPEGTTFGYLMGVFIGAAVVSLITWFTMKFASRSLSRILINATEFKEEAYVLMFNCGFGVIMLVVACVYFFFVIIFLLLKAGIIEGLPDDKTDEVITKLGIACCGYALGIIVACFVYREATSVFSRGIFNSLDGLVKTDKNLSFNNPYISHQGKVAYLIQNLLNLQIVNVLDVTICLVVLTVSAFVIFSNSAEVIAEEITYKSLLAPTIYISVNVFCAVIVQLFKTVIYENEAAAFAKMNCRLQVIITHCVTIVIFLSMPIATILEEFSVTGKESPEALKKEAITQNRITWCCIFAQLANLGLLCFLEWITSHGCRPVQNMQISSVDRIPNQSHHYASYLNGIGGFTFILIMAILIIVLYALAGWVGFMAGAAGFFINILIMVPIFYIGAMSSDAYKLCCMGIVNQIVTDRLYKFAWAARNYYIYLRMTNAGKNCQKIALLGTAILLGLCFLGCSLFFMNAIESIFLDIVGVFGIIVGIILALIVRSLTIGAIIYLSKKYDFDPYKHGVAVEVTQNNSLHDYLRYKFWNTMKWIYFIFILNTVLLLVFGFFFGRRGTAGFLLGHIIIIMFLFIQSLIQGTALKNARYYNEANEQLSKRDSIYNQYVYGDMTGTIEQESTSLPLIVYLLYNVVLVTALYPFFGKDGVFFSDLYAEDQAEF